MTQRPIAVRIPTSCSQPWAAMTPTSDGRHCAACTKTVVDFTEKTDTEILAYLRQLGAGETCGRLRADQLNRPLVPATTMAASSRWRTWLAAAVAAWGLREGSSLRAGSQPLAASYTHHSQKQTTEKAPITTTPKQLRGVVRDAATQVPLVGVAIFLKGENQQTSTDSTGHFSLRLPLGRAPHTLVLHLAGYRSQTVPLLAAAPTLELALEADPAAAGVEVMAYAFVHHTDITGGVISTVLVPPATQPASHNRSFFRWLARPFRRE
ncbi:carboxypeptidase-like regulatory domain-containing protein [Hymenobacter sp. UV11]|uniref:carboxypeptidase-like regulatory domain-containing protein n=1 Tax=Hymenobacter sp. UV11 TaxID=1849735 RepID=UPI001414EA4E|nr:carboxypeptidase-like regulatory domain-containing protein [Hymenobacter sp. UV11]